MPELYEPKPGTPRAILVDIDGTVALRGDRSPYDETRVHEDLPNQAVITNVQGMFSIGHQLVFCSGRTDGCRTATEQWLKEHVDLGAVDWDYAVHIGVVALHMREVGDNRKDSIVKREIFDREIRDRYDITFVLDDRASVVQMWRSLGLTVLQVAEGNF